MYVVEYVTGLIYVPLFVACNARQDTEFQQQAADPDQGASLAGSLQGEVESAGGKIRIRRSFQQTFTEGSQRNLRFGALEHRAGETQERVALTVELRQAAPA